MESKTRVVVFGIFDGVHDGHRDFFRQARQYGDELIAIVGRDEIAITLKGKKSKHSEVERLAMLKQEKLVDDAILGDRKLSTYTVLVRCNPDVVCLGYDQGELEADLQHWIIERDKKIELHRAKPYQEEDLHNSLL